MSDEINYKTNPLHGLSLKKLLVEVVDYYGFDILYAYLHINCFKTNPSIESSVKFLKKTDWAREKVESFYMYQFKSLPRASKEQFQLPPRDRVVPDGEAPGAPRELSIEDADQLREKQAKKAADFDSQSRSGRQRPPKTEKPRREYRAASKKKSSSNDASSDPYAKWRK